MVRLLVGLLPWKALARTFVADYLMDPKVKEQVIQDLRKAAQETETKFDDAAVDRFEDMWSVVVPALVKKL